MLLEITQKTMRTSMEVMVGELGRHDFREKKFFFFFISHYVHCAMIKRKTFFFHLGTTFNTPWLQKKFDFY